jgi:hypothetical protein
LYNPVQRHTVDLKFTAVWCLYNVSLKSKTVIPFFNVKLFLVFFLIVLLGIHCGIYKSSYNVSNISYLNSPPPLLSFICPSLHPWNGFNRYHFYIYIFLHSVFASYSFSYALFLSPPPSTNSHCLQDMFHKFYRTKKKMTVLLI